MPDHIMIRRVLSESFCNQSICVRGWVRTKRDSKDISFINLNDGSNGEGIQIVLGSHLENYEVLLKLNTGAALEVRGTLVVSAGKGQAYELQASQVKVYGDASGTEYPLQKKGHSLEFLREMAHLRPRTNTFGAVFRIRDGLCHAVHQFFQERDFLQVHGPVITSSDAEGAGSMFQVTTLDLEKLPKKTDGTVDFTQDFFSVNAHLTVSAQLEAEIFASAFSQVYSFGPTFRAENSNTSRHLSEFWMIEPEMAFYDLQDDATLAESFLKQLIIYCLENHSSDLEFLQQYYDKTLITTLDEIAHSKFQWIDYTDAVGILEKASVSFEFPVQWGLDLQSEHERFLAEQYFKKPVIVMNYPKQIKAFYMRLNDDQRTVAAMDVLFPKIGEIIGGSQREERLSYLEEAMRQQQLDLSHYWWYLDLRRFGTVPHAGFGLGFERLVQFVTGMANIRDTIPFPRFPKHVSF